MELQKKEQWWKWEYSIFFISILWSFSLTAQEEEQDENSFYQFPQYSFVNYHQNEIHTFSPQTLEHVFEQMAKLQKHQDRQVHIVHIGDSHIQADIFTDAIRRKFRLDKRFPISSRGFTFPYRAAKTNNPYNYRTSYTGRWEGKRSPSGRDKTKWGMSGVTAITYSSGATITMNPNTMGLYYPVNKIKVFYPTEDRQNFKVNLLPEAGNFVTSYLENDGFVEFNLRNPQNQIELSFEKNSVNQKYFYMQGVSLENYEPGLVYSASGVNGAKVTSYFRCESFVKNLKALSPDLVVLSLGTNDAYYSRFNHQQFKTNYSNLISTIKAAIPHVSILVTTAGDSYRRRRYANNNNERVRQIIFELAKELDFAVWDFYTVMGGYRSIQKWYNNGLSQRDKLHLTTRGYRFQGQLFFEAFDKAYSGYYQRKGN